MRAFCISVLMATLLIAGCATSEGESYAMAGYDFSGLNKIAIVDVSGKIYGDTVKNEVANLFTMEMMKKGYAVIERSAALNKIREEQEFQASDLTSPEDAARAGRILNVPAVLMINIPKYKSKMEMTAKLVEVETASILWIGSGSGNTNRGLATVVGAGLGAAAGAVIAGGDTNDRVIGGVIGGAAGGVAGYALSPEQRKQVKKVIAKVCEDLPPRVPQAK